MRFLSAAALFLAALPAFAASKIALVTNGDLLPPAKYGLAQLTAAIRKSGAEIVASPAQADSVIVLEQSASLGAQALTIRNSIYRSKPSIDLSGGDPTGLMYAALDTAERISWSTSDAPFQYIRDVTEKPFIADRGISMYTMHRKYFESRLYDEQYWTRYFDTLAASRLNNFVVIFGYENGGFMAPLYPYFFNVDGFPGVEFVGITPEQQAIVERAVELVGDQSASKEAYP